MVNVSLFHNLFIFHLISLYKVSYAIYFLAEGSHLEEMDVDSSLKSLTMRRDDSIAMPTCIASVITGQNLLTYIAISYLLW